MESKVLYVGVLLRENSLRIHQTSSVLKETDEAITLEIL